VGFADDRGGVGARVHFAAGAEIVQIFKRADDLQQQPSPPFDVRREALPVFFIDLIAWSV
jgi:hypothetical protein